MATKAYPHDRNEPSRRRVPRFDLPAPVDVTVMRSGVSDSIPGRSVNICERGVALVLAGELVPGESVNIDLLLPKVSDPLRARAVVKHQSGFSCGMEFRGLSAVQRAMIRDCMKQMEKKGAGEFELARTTRPVAKKRESKRGQARTESSKNPELVGDDGPPGPPSWGSNLTKFWPLSSGWTLFLIAALIVAMLFWWKWNRGWEEVESGLRQETALDKPQARVSAEEMERLLIHRVDPIYPTEARQNHLQAIIALDVVIGRDGSVISMKPLNGPEILARAAMDSLRWWKFKPYRVNGNPVAVETTMAVEFKP